MFLGLAYSSFNKNGLLRLKEAVVFLYNIHPEFNVMRPSLPARKSRKIIPDVFSKSTRPPAYEQPRRRPISSITRIISSALSISFGGC